MARKNKTEKLQELLEKEEQLKKAKHDLLKAMKAEEKKEREKRYKSTGELVESCFDIGHLSLEERELLFTSISTYVNSQVAQNFPKQNNDSEEKNRGSSEDEPEEITVTSSDKIFQVS
ncbi:hypothetical protein SAMN04488168_12319 [Bacillus sp. 491mf]|uniref:restriction endonuclease n=1 Tax=Bacillus sp. 491mf TaxID=1761755 RepID=UPI0008E791D6|nr:restriction endonuclease [Bacillus sp. 491mf]SFD18100.1 hypothetical protein SAMN04488168_12319 [Bacillus sp. 491mf]